MPKAQNFLIELLTHDESALSFYLNNALYGLFYFKREDVINAQADKKLLHFLGIQNEEESFNLFPFLDASSQLQIEELENLTGQEVLGKERFLLIWKVNGNKYQTICTTYWHQQENVILVGLGDIEQLPKNSGEKYFDYIAEHSSEAINEDLKLFKKIIESGVDGLQVADKSGQMVFCNNFAAARLGINKEDVHKYHVTNFSSTLKTQNDWDTYFNDTKKFGKITLEGIHLHPSTKKTFPVEIIASYANVNDKEYVIASTRDISERKKSEEEIRKYVERLDNSQRLAKMGDFTWELDSGKLSWSNGLYELLGYDKSEKLDYEKVSQETYHPDDAERIKNWLKECVESGKPYHEPNEYRFIRKDGKILNVRTTISVEFKEDKPFKIVGTIFDVTEYMLVEQKLTNSEAELVRQEAFYQKLFDNVLIGLLIADKETTMLEINDAACATIGLPREALIGAKINDPQWILFDENYRQFTLEERPVCITAATGKAVAPLKMGYYKHDEPEKVKWVELSSSPIFNDDGELDRIVCTFLDVTERHEVANQLQLEKTRIENIIDGVKLGTWEWHTEDNYFEVNAQLAEMVGYKLEELQHKSFKVWKQFIHPDDLNKASDAVLTHIKQKTENYRAEFRMKHKLGHWVWILARGKVISWDDEGNPILFAGTHSDITERKQKEEDLRLFETAIKNAKDTVLISKINPKDPLESSLIFANEAFCKLTGFEVHELKEKSPEMLRGPLTDTKTIKKIEKATKNFEAFEYELINYKKNKEPFWINLSATPVKDEKGEFTHWVTIQKDITQQKKQEEGLRLFESVIKNTKDAVLITEAEPFDLPGPKIVFVNEAFCKMTGYTPDELIGQTPRMLQGPKSDRKILDKVKISLENWQSCEYDLINYKKNGEEFWVNMSITPLANETGWFTHWIAVERDITENKKATALLEASEKKYRQLVENTNDIIYSVSPDGIFTFTSPAWQRLLGHTKEESEGYSFTEFVHSDDIPICATYLQKVLDTGEAQEEVIEYRVKHKEGHWVWYASSGAPQKDSSGKVIGYDGLARDITESKKMQEQLIEAKEKAEESEQRFKLATNSAQLGIWEWNIEDNIVIWDDKTYELFGYNKDQISSSFDLWANSLHPEDRERALEEVNNILRGSGEYHTTVRVFDKDGKEVYINSYGLVIRDVKDNAIRMIGVHRDITEEKAKEIELEKAKDNAEAASLAKSEFLANMSHEIRTPLNSVIGFSELLMQTQLDSSQKDYMKSVNYSANTLLDLINDVLDFSKIEAGKLELALEKTNLYWLLYQVVEMIKLKLNEKDVELLLYISPDVPQYIFSDTIRIRQILMNLMGNAVKFTESGEIEASIIKIDSSNDDKKVSLRFVVRDTGIGISEQQQQNIFEVFSQEDASITRKYGGTGLGLPISNQLLHLMNSSLQLSSEQGKGSFFYFDIDFEYEKGASIERESIEGIHTILLVDDNVRSREIIESLLTSNHIKVEVAGNGVEALGKIQANWQDYDAVLLDYKMPFMDGAEVIKQIKEKLQLNKKQLPILLMDNLLDEEEYKQLEENYSVVGFIRKPVIQKELIELLSTLNTIITENPIVTDITIDKREIANFSEKSILIVDDNAINRNLAKNMVKKLYEDVEVFEAKNGKEAIEKVLQHDFSMIFMDIQMPDMSGYETTKRIRNLQGEKSQVSIVALTAGAVKGERERCLAVGMNDYLSKPVTMDKLESMVKKWVNEDKSQSEVDTQVLNEPKAIRLDFNYETLKIQLGGDEEIIEGAFGIIREGELRKLILKLGEIEDFVSESEALKELAHRIKGIGLNLCFEKLTDLSEQLENMYPYYSIQEAKPLIRQIEEAYQIVEKIVLKRKI